MKYSVLSLSGSCVETAPQARTLFNPRRGPLFRLDSFLARVEYLLKNRKVGTILVDHHLDFAAALPGALEAIRAQLERLARGGKRLVYYARIYDTAALYLASSCAERVVHPLGTLRFPGMAHRFVFFKKLIERYDIDVEVVRRGRYKSAADRFRVERIDENNREQYQAALDSTMKGFKEAVETGCSKSEAEIEELLAGRVLSPEEAVSMKWATRVATKNTLIEEWRKEKAREVGLAKVKVAFGKGARVAVLAFEGAIVDGRTRQDPVLGQSIGSDSFIPEVEKLKKNRSIKGVVLRINSGGGSAIASEEIAEALEGLAEKKPLVVSMGGVAGSGGYWIATPAERIFAQRSTITGSIGVISILLSLAGGLERAGITASTVKVGELADIGSPLKAFTERERSVIDAEVDRLYRLFLSKVAASRKSTPEAIHRIAEGRIWSGEDAKREGLVDEIGGLTDALAYLKEKLGAKRLRVGFHPVVKYSLVQRLIMRNAAVVDSGHGGAPMPAGVASTAAFAFRSSVSPWTGIAARAALAASFLAEAQSRPLALMEDVGDYR